MIFVSLLLLINAIYSGGGCCSEKYLVDGSIYLSVMFEYVSFPVCPGYMCIVKCM